MILPSFIICLSLIFVKSSKKKSYDRLTLAQLKHKINSGIISKVEASLQRLSKEWEIDRYPKFLKTCFMEEAAWDTMKWKYIAKILEKERSPTSDVFFTFSFTGSSVTAGHDSYFNQSTPAVVEEYMKDAFVAAGVELRILNGAIGNNPCYPYDVCVKYFTGNDADVVVWEQSYFCHNTNPLELFMRNAMMLPMRPIVVFSESNTSTW